MSGTGSSRPRDLLTPGIGGLSIVLMLLFLVRIWGELADARVLGLGILRLDAAILGALVMPSLGVWPWSRRLVTLPRSDRLDFWSAVLAAAGAGPAHVLAYSPGSFGGSLGETVIVALAIAAVAGVLAGLRRGAAVGRRVAWLVVAMFVLSVGWKLVVHPRVVVLLAPIL